MSHTNYYEQMTYDFKSILSEMCKCNPVSRGKDQAGPCCGSGWVSAHGIGISRVLGRLRPGWGTAGDPGSGWGSRAELSCSVWDLGLWLVVPRDAGQGCPVPPGPWESSPVQRAGLEWHCWGCSPVRSSPLARSTVEVTPSCADLCRGSAVSGHAQNQCWKRPTGSSRPTVWHWFSLTWIWLLLTKWKFLSKLTF